MPPPKDMPNILRAPGDYEVTSTVHNDTYPEIDCRSSDLSGSAVFISGGSRGLGRAMALSFARAGTSYIAVGARSDLSSLAKEVDAVAALAQRPLPRFLSIRMDVLDQSSVDAAASEVETAFGRLDVLINNAGTLGKYGLIGDSDAQEWSKVINTNLIGPYLVTRAFLPLLLRSQGSRYIVNVASGGALLSNPTLSAYQVSKSALLKLSVLTNVEYASKGITSFAIHPGNVPTDIMGGPDAIPEHHKHVFIETPELSADSVVFLVSQQSQWLGGRYVNCTWDLPELVAMKEEIVKEDRLKIKLDY